MSISEHLLSERWSHSEEVDRYVEYIYDKVKRPSLSEKHGKTGVKDLFFREGDCAVEIFGIALTLHYKVYSAFSEEALIYAVQNFNGGNGIDAEKKILYLTFFTYLNEVFEKATTPNIMHEVEHLLQISKGHKSSVDITTFVDKIYAIAYNVLTAQGHTKEETAVATLIYLSNPHEQDAMMNEYYCDLANNEQFLTIDSRRTMQTLNIYKICAKWLEENKNTNMLKNILLQYREYGLTQGVLGSMVKKGVARFERKMRNVEKHYQQQVKSLNEMNLHHGRLTRYGSLLWIG